jgi:CHAT domain-containing protein
MPVHAAGMIHGATKETASDYIVSSYVPTLSTLTKARLDWKPIPRAQVSGLLLCESSPPNARYLSGVLQEVNLVRTCFEAVQVQVMNPPSGHTARAQMQSLLTNSAAHTLHLASHGIQASDPLKSAFLLRDGRFLIEDIMALNLQHAVLAFLSACETARGDRDTPDEAVHLAASMLFCGFRSVIGTMW